jgi:hypothetical protein
MSNAKRGRLIKTNKNQLPDAAVIQVQSGPEHIYDVATTPQFEFASERPTISASKLPKKRPLTRGPCPWPATVPHSFLLG